jgi:hypothetical protein
MSMIAPVPPGVGAGRSDERVAAPSERAERVDEPDEVLWSAVLAGRDRRAFAALFDRYGTVVRAFARRLGRSEELACDITQEVFLRLWSVAATLEVPEGTVRSRISASLHALHQELAVAAPRGAAPPPRSSATLHP